MLFEVIDSRDGCAKMSTSHESCIYPREILLSMQAAGYIFRMNGKDWKPPQRKRKVEA